jgi:hypothetical protein
MLGYGEKEMPPEVLEYFARVGRAGGRIGGKVRAANMTGEQRSEGARKASQARWAREKAKSALG